MDSVIGCIVRLLILKHGHNFEKAPVIRENLPIFYLSLMYFTSLIFEFKFFAL